MLGGVRIVSTPLIILPAVASPNVELYTRYVTFPWLVVTYLSEMLSLAQPFVRTKRHTVT
jgi:hypothetical protein